jgi:conjugative transfer region protein (TIGR03748 family)
MNWGNHKIAIVLSVIGFIILKSASVLAADLTEVGRYLTVDNKPKFAQTDLLSQTIQVRFPQNVQTVGDAMNYILRLSGYSLVSAEKMSHALTITLSKPLPAVDRDFGPMPLKEGLATLTGPAFYSVQDPLNRVVNFRVKSQYVHFANNSSSD